MANDFIRQLGGERLVTALIFYRFPDYPSLLQQFLWQDFDLVPNIPKLSSFLEFWISELDGPLHSVEYIYPELITINEVRIQNRRVRIEY